MARDGYVDFDKDLNRDFWHVVCSKMGKGMKVGNRISSEPCFGHRPVREEFPRVDVRTGASLNNGWRMAKFLIRRIFNSLVWGGLFFVVCACLALFGAVATSNTAADWLVIPAVVVPLVGGIVGVVLGLCGRLPGTQGEEMRTANDLPPNLHFGT